MIAVAWETGHTVLVALALWVVAGALVVGMACAAIAHGALWAGKRLYASLSPVAAPEAPDPHTSDTERPTAALRPSATPTKSHAPTQTEGAH